MTAGKSALQRLVDSLPHLVWTCDGDGLCDYLSVQWVEYTGIPEAEQLGFGWLEQLHPDDRELTQRRWGAAAESKGVFDTEFRIRRHDGVYRWFKTRAVPELDAHGAIVAWYGTNTDIQELKDVEAANAALAAELEERVAAQTKALHEANDQLRTAAVQLETAQRITKVGSWELDIASGAVVWSEELFRVFRLPQTEGAPAYETQAGLFAPESWERLTAAVARAAETGEGYELVLTAIDSGGQSRLTIARAESIRDEETGEIVRLVGTFQDITERLEAEETLRRTTERLQLATRAGRIGVWDWDVAGGSLVWDRTMHEIYGTDPETSLGTYDDWRSALHPDDRASIEERLQQALAGESTFDGSFRIQVAGEVRHIRVDSEVTRDAAGRPLRMTGVNQDITEQRVAELTLRRAEALQRGILEAAGLAVIATDVEGTITQINPAAEELLGYRADELVGRASPAVFHDADEVMTRKAALEEELGVDVETPFETFVIKARGEGRPDANEWTYIRKDGSRVPVWLVVSTIRDGDDVLGYLGVAADLTDRKRSEAQLVSLNELLARRTDEAEAASHAKSRFLANMSHEIRTPIGAITGVTYLLGRADLSDEQRHHVETIERSAKSLLAMVNDVLDLSKIEADQLRLDEEPFSLGALLGDLETMMVAYATDRSLVFSVEVKPGVPDRLVGDRVRLMQVLVNLSSNAIKFTDRGTVSVVVSREGKSTRFEVRDTGVGMEPERARRVFQPFTQAHSTSRPGGTGLGLAIVQELVTLMDGSVGIESVPGEGTLVWVEVPLGEPDREAPSPSLAIARVLLVASSALVRQSLAAHSAALGWRVSVVTTGREAVERVLETNGEHPFDVVIVAHDLTDMSGRDVSDRISEAAPTDRPAIVLLADPTTERTSVVDVVDGVLREPLSSSSLYDAVVSASARRRGPAHLGVVEPISPQVQRLPGARVLVVDDSELNRRLARQILSLEGATVLEAADGVEAIERAKNDDELDIVLMDMQMPGLDGVETCRRILADPRRAKLPILALTAGAFRSERDRAFEAGMVDFVTKPYDPEQLIAKLRLHVSRARGKQLGVASRDRPRHRESTWPAVSGIDAAEASGRLGGDQALFRRLLAMMGSELEEEQVAAYLEGDDEQAQAWLHRLRGAAGNLGAQELHRLASEGERALREGDRDRFEDMRSGLLVAIERLRQGIRDIGVPTPVQERSTEEARALAPADVEQLLELLSEQNLGAVDLIGELSDSLLQELGDERYDELAAAVGRLDFAAARQLVETLVGDD